MEQQIFNKVVDLLPLIVFGGAAFFILIIIIINHERD